jgi:carbon storage regulator
MLVLSRQRDESIMIGDNIVVTIVDIRGDKVRLGINAPSEIPVHRQEVYEAIQRENLRASRLEPGDTQDIGRFANRGGNRPGGEPQGHIRQRPISVSGPYPSAAHIRQRPMCVSGRCASAARERQGWKYGG